MNSSCTVSVTFTPTSAGAKTTTLSIASNDLATPKDVALSGTGVLTTYTIGTGVVGGNGTISCVSPVNAGANSICTISPNAGYHLATFTDDSVDKMASVAANSYTISNVTAGHTVAGTFALNNYTVSFTSNGGSAVGNQTVAYNTATSAPTAPTKTGSTFAGWYSDSGLTAAFVFTTAITADTTLYAKWTVDSLPPDPITTFSVSFVSSGNGTLTGSASQTVNSGASASAVTAVPASGYHFVNWTGTGGFVTSTANPLTVVNVTAAQTITANFAIDAAVPVVPHDGIINPTDGKTAPTISDALALLNHLAGITILTSDQLIHADVAPLGAGGSPLGNGVIDFSDVIIILRRSIGIGSW